MAKTKRPMTKKDTVIKYLSTHKSGLTKAQAEDKLGIDNLKSVVQTIRRSGIDVVCDKKVTKKTGKVSYVYSLG